MNSSTPPYDPYAGMKTPGQRQLISLQERVKVGEISVEEAVQEFRAWQADHERRASSIRYQQVNPDEPDCEWPLTCQLSVMVFTVPLVVGKSEETTRKHHQASQRERKNREEPW